METMELEASLYSASENLLSSIMTSNAGKNGNVGSRRRKVIHFFFI